MKKNRLLDLCMLLLMGFTAVMIFTGCKTVKPTVNTTSSKSDSTGLQVNKQLNETDSTHSKPALNIGIDLPLQVDTNTGKVKDQKLTVKSGNDSTTVEINNNRLKVNTNCEAQVSRWKTIAERTDSILKHTQAQKDSVYVQAPPVTVTEYRTPWYDYVIITLEGVVILFLLYKLFKPLSLLKKFF